MQALLLCAIFIATCACMDKSERQRYKGITLFTLIYLRFVEDFLKFVENVKKVDNYTFGREELKELYGEDASVEELEHFAYDIIPAAFFEITTDEIRRHFRLKPQKLDVDREITKEEPIDPDVSIDPSVMYHFQAIILMYQMRLAKNWENDLTRDEVHTGVIYFDERFPYIRETLRRYSERLKSLEKGTLTEDNINETFDVMITRGLRYAEYYTRKLRLYLMEEELRSEKDEL